MTEAPSPDTSAALLESTEAGVLRITLNRPQAANALTPSQRERIIALLAAADGDREVRAIVIAANGRHFCSGADVSTISAAPRAGEGMKRIRDGAQRLVAAVLDCAKPVIAAVQGPAAGLGAHLAFACDLVVAAENATFIEAFVLRGITLDAGGAYLLARRVGLQKAKELVFFGEPLPAAAAAELGLVNRVVSSDELEAQVAAYASRLAAAPTTALGLAKLQLNSALDSDRAGSFLAEAMAQEIVSKSEDAQEGIAAFIGRRAPHFKGY